MSAVQAAGDSNRGWSPFDIACAVVVLTATAASSYWLFNQLANVEHEGSIVWSQVSMQRTDNQLQLDAVADVTLPANMRAGLDNGLPLTFIMDLRLLRPRQWWLHKTVVHFQQRYTLTYYELTRHYRVYSVDSDTSRNFRSLSSALNGLGEFNEVDFILEDEQQQAIIEPGLVGSMQLRLDTTALPLPLQPLLRSSWNLASEEYLWPVI